MCAGDGQGGGGGGDSGASSSERQRRTAASVETRSSRPGAGYGASRARPSDPRYGEYSSGATAAPCRPPPRSVAGGRAFAARGAPCAARSPSASRSAARDERTESRAEPRSGRSATGRRHHALAAGGSTFCIPGRPAAGGVRRQRRQAPRRRARGDPGANCPGHRAERGVAPTPSATRTAFGVDARKAAACRAAATAAARRGPGQRRQEPRRREAVASAWTDYSCEQRDAVIASCRARAAKGPAMATESSPARSPSTRARTTTRRRQRSDSDPWGRLRVQPPRAAELKAAGRCRSEAKRPGAESGESCAVNRRSRLPRRFAASGTGDCARDAPPAARCARASRRARAWPDLADHRQYRKRDSQERSRRGHEAKKKEAASRGAHAASIIHSGTAGEPAPTPDRQHGPPRAHSVDIAANPQHRRRLHRRLALGSPAGGRARQLTALEEGVESGPALDTCTSF